MLSKSTLYAYKRFYVPDYETVAVNVDKPGFRKQFLLCIYKHPKGEIDRYIYILCMDNLLNFKNKEKWILGDFDTNIELCNTPDVPLV